ncbi:MAG: hypothetical protein PVH68_16210 [Armatimonadota bacterium]|jgi:hypothetical protein
MDTPYGDIEANILTMSFSSADFSVASVMAAVREHLDVLTQMDVVFLGTATEVPTGPTPVFRPVNVQAVFEYTGRGDAREVLERAYRMVWQGIVGTFPSETDWAAAKKDFAQFISSQADLLRARVEGVQE